MMNASQHPLNSPAPLTVHDMDRRSFLARTAAAGVAWPLVGPVADRAAAVVRPEPVDAPETLVKTLFDSLTEEQRGIVTFPFDHPLRSKVDNNWNITQPSIQALFNADQREMVRQIFTGIHSPEYAETVMGQVVHDSGKEGFGACSIALFGEPGSGRFEFVLTGRHCTRRCDGDSVAGAAFGGPIFYGHAAKGFYEKADHPGNAYWYQAKRANEVFQMLDGKQRELALLADARKENGTKTVRLTGKTSGLPGIPLTELSADQKGLVRAVLSDLLAPFREADAKEAMKLIEMNGFDRLHMAFYKNGDIGNDGVWDVWQIEGPAMLWFFRGEPHVHVWAHIREDAAPA